MIIEDQLTGYINASSVTDVYYILRKAFSDQKSRAMISCLLNLLQVIEVTKDDCLIALVSPLSDFEDALVTVCADKVDIDYIVTRDDEFLETSKVGYAHNPVGIDAHVVNSSRGHRPRTAHIARR